jgi:hypothetical protein
MAEQLSPAQIAALLAKLATGGYTAGTTTRPAMPPPPQVGPVRWHDITSPNKSLRCASRGCSSSTPWKVNNVPYCTVHTIYALNALVLQLTDEQLPTEGLSARYPTQMGAATSEHNTT